MGALILFVLSVLLVVGGQLLRRSVAGYEPARSCQWGPFSVELRRRVLLHGHPDGRGRLALAQPSETRIRVFRVAGMPVWFQSRTIDLPVQVANMFSSLTARDFDFEFDPRFREIGYAQVLPATWNLWWGRERGFGGDH